MCKFQSNQICKIKIKCSIHGLFKQIANDHLQGYGCPKCGGTSKLNTTNFIEKAINKHGNKYDYSLTEYFNIKTKVKNQLGINIEIDNLYDTYIAILNRYDITLDNLSSQSSPIDGILHDIICIPMSYPPNDLYIYISTSNNTIMKINISAPELLEPEIWFWNYSQMI